ncbi:Syntaxin 16 [Spironucleus salmonicida]|uniref:Syntaxin 16 n=1 Tax=Spironucleus salmonicida TaxID=348837 RepID=V6LTN4_9EUKA|nr:Syntaxin 16 [Spironucleus salmonicida]|eukprot:EST47608.1 Syntaxin 16 [Spironucleus salmonicida]
MSIDYTKQLQKYRPKKLAQPPQFQDLPEYAQTATQLLADLSQINQRINQLQQKFSLKQNQLFQDALNQEILFLKSDIQQRLQTTTQKISNFDSTKCQSNEQKQYQQPLILSLKSKLALFSTIFRTFQSRFMSQLTNEINTIQKVDIAQIPEEQQQVYLQAKKQIDADKAEAKYICNEIQGIMELINQMASSVYEQGTVLDRIERNIMQAQEFAVQGVQNLEKARQDQKKVGMLRKVTYGILIIDMIMMIIYAIIG